MTGLIENLVFAALILCTPFAFANRADDLEESSPAAEYWVPVGTQLADYALFQIPHVRVTRDADDVEIRYPLPVELTGVENHIVFNGAPTASGPMTLTGVNGKMECPSATDLSNCAISYKNLAFDQAARTTLLKSISATPDEVSKRELVAARFEFGGEPHGFLRVKSGP